MTMTSRQKSRLARQSPLVARFRRQEAAVATPSPGWKESLRQACLDRARRKRRDLVMRKRRQLSFDDNDGAEDQPARMVVEEELRRRGVAIHSACFEEESTAISQECGIGSDPMMAAMTQDYDEVEEPMDDPYSRSIGDHFISEEDLFDLLQEVENELQCDEDLLVDELLEAEQMYLQDQIADFEQWEETKTNDTAIEEQVLCPICQTSDLMTTPDLHVICPGESCSFRLETIMTDRPLPLLREQLRRAHEEHAKACTANLHFETRVYDGQNTLVASCESCILMYTIV